MPAVTRRLENALRRGVEVVILVPAEPEPWVRTARRNPAHRPLFEGIEALARHDNFMLAGLVAMDGRAGPRPTYVHAKTMLVDDAWVTIGSCNLHSNSLSGHTEMNAAIWDPKVSRALRCELLAEHLAHDTDGFDDRAALRLFRQVAMHNRIGAAKQGINSQGLAFALAPSEYGG